MTILPLGSGKCSTFGGALDAGVGTREGLGLIETTDLNDWWFRRLFVFPGLWNNAEGLARNLDASAFYCAMRWDFCGLGDVLLGLSREQVRRTMLIVEAHGRVAFVQPCDSGPNLRTDRLIDLSPGAARHLGVGTDDVVTVSAVA